MRFKLVVTIGLCGAAIAGCGGGGNSTLSRAKLDETANAICSATHTALLKVPTSADTGAYLASILPVFDKGTSQLYALRPDSSVSADWNVFIETLREDDRLYKEAKTKFKAGDTSAGLGIINSVGTVETELKGQAAKVGATSCKI